MTRFTVLATACVLVALTTDAVAEERTLAELPQASLRSIDAYAVEESYGDDADVQIYKSKRFEVGGLATAVWIVCEFERDGCFVGLARWDGALVGPMTELDAGTMYGTSRVEQVYLGDLVDGPEPEIVVHFSGHDLGTVEDDYESETAGVAWEAWAILDTGLHVLATVRGAQDPNGETYAVKCSADVVLTDDSDGDGRPELVASRVCDGENERVAKAVAAARPAPPPKALPTEPIADDKPFVVVAGSFKQTAADGLQLAKAKAREIREDDGYADASVFDSRQFTEFGWGFYAVVAGRYATKEEAAEVADDLSHHEAYVKQGFYELAPLPEPSPTCSEARVVLAGRGYRARFEGCPDKVVSVAHRASGKAKKTHEVVAWPSGAELVGVHEMTDAAGKPNAAAVEVAGGDVRVVVVAVPDKDDLELVYAATLPSDADVSVVDGELVLGKGAARRSIRIGRKGKAKVERVDDTALAPPASFVADGWSIDAKKRD